MAFISARLSHGFSAFLHGLPADEKKKMDAILADIRMMNNPSEHQKLGDARMYTAGFWVRDAAFISGMNMGKNRLIYSQITKDAEEIAQNFPGHVTVYGIGNPHVSSGFSQVNTFADIKWEKTAS